jgi:hypothetical protein
MLNSLLSPKHKISNCGLEFRSPTAKEIHESAVAVENELLDAIGNARNALFEALEAQGEDPFVHGADCAFSSPTGIEDFVSILLQNFTLVKKEEREVSQV